MRAILASVVLAAALLASCGQGEGDRCEQDADCDDGLVCCIRVGENEGTCQKPEDCTMDMAAGSLGVSTDRVGEEDE